jgi:hypothetical protein
VTVGNINTENAIVTYTGGRCFQNIKFSYAQSGDSNDIGDVTLTIDTEKAQSLFCSDWFFFGTNEMYHIESFYLSGNH